MSGFEENEISKNAFGGTEITKRSIAKSIAPELADQFQIIASRLRDIQEDKIRIYWLHDLPEDPESQHLRTSHGIFHSIVASSNWQLNEFATKLQLPMSEKVQVIETPCEVFPGHAKPTDKINLVYFSTPQRGLEILVPVFEHIAQNDPNVHLHVHSSFKIYGWDQADAQFEPLYERVRQHPQMTYHGFTPADKLRESLLDMHILAYPCIWKETSCRVLIESMMAGLYCVHPNYGALPDTAGGLTAMYQYCDDPNMHASIFCQNLLSVIQRAREDITNQSTTYIEFLRKYSSTRYNQERINRAWQAVLTNLSNKYPDIASRKPPVKMFEYNR